MIAGKLKVMLATDKTIRTGLDSAEKVTHFCLNYKWISKALEKFNAALEWSIELKTKTSIVRPLRPTKYVIDAQRPASPQRSSFDETPQRFIPSTRYVSRLRACFIQNIFFCGVLKWACMRNVTAIETVNLVYRSKMEFFVKFDSFYKIFCCSCSSDVSPIHADRAD